MYENKFLFLFFVLSIFLVSCSGADMEIYDGENQNSNLDPKYNYSIFETGLVMSDNAILHVRFYTNEERESENILFLLHGEDEVLEDWNMLSEYFINDIDILSIDIRGYGKSTKYADGTKINIFDFDETDYKKLTNDLIEVFDNFTYDKVIFVGSGIGSNLILKSSPEFCTFATDFILVSPITKSSFLAIESFDKYCEDSNYLYINNESNNKKREVERENIERLTFYTNENGINLISNNSIIIKKIKDRITNLELN